ncbi:MAG TPA: DEAD/DEAH box helicase [Helicobacteraceae bacterium]|nr:DEAD/DEAH box helicase [Helicobacteraceae bacterium]
MSFDTLGLSKPILKAIKEQGYTTPTPIQQQAIPVVLKKKDLLAGAQTGTGKTAGFTLPLLQNLLDTPPKKGKKQVRALILTPTRELAAQVAESVATYGKYLDYNSAVIFGGVGINPQIAQLKRGVDIVIATPGRLLDLVNQKVLNLTHVEYFILDEADRMLDMGFIHDIKKVIALLPKNRQNLLFSATFSDEIKKISDTLLRDPALIEVARRNTASETVDQAVHLVDKVRKRELLTHLINAGQWQQVLVFTRTKHGANRLSEQLNKDGISAAAIHGNKSQSARTKALSNFKMNTIRVLVATDIAARGIDIDQLPHVVNFELPNVAEDYVHRIGRTGRAGNEGQAISLVCVDELDLLKNIEKLIKRPITKIKIDGFKVDPSIAAEPIQNGRGRSRQTQRQKSRPTKNSTARTKNGTQNAKKKPAQKEQTSRKEHHNDAPSHKKKRPMNHHSRRQG